MKQTLIEGDCVAVMAAMPEASIGAVCTDPPYLLTGAGKNGLDCLTRILAEVQFPQDKQFDSESLEGHHLPSPPDSRAFLRGVDRPVRVKARIRVPEAPVDFKHTPIVKHEVTGRAKPSGGDITNGVLTAEAHPDFQEHLGDFILQLADGGDAAFCDGACCCYTELGFGRIAVFVRAPNLADFVGFHASDLSISTGYVDVLPNTVGGGDDAFYKAQGTPFVVAGPRTEHGAVLTLDLRGATGELRTAHSTRQDNLLPRRRVAVLVAASAGAIEHVPMLQPCRVRIVDGAAARTLTLYVPLHRFASLDGSTATGGFMGKAWDGGVSTPQAAFRWHTRWLVEAHRVLAPGAPLAAFSGTRTYHRLAAAMHDAGFDGDSIVLKAHLNGSGFNKGPSLGNLIDKAAGAEREVLGPNPNARPNSVGARPVYGDHTYAPLTAPATDAAKLWAGWRTTIRPCWEPILCVRKGGSEPTPAGTQLRVVNVLRKPLGAGNLADNCLRWGTGGLNIDGCRVAAGADTLLPAGRITSKAQNTGAEPDAGRGQARVEFVPEASRREMRVGRVLHDGPVADVADAECAVEVAAKGRVPANVIMRHAEGCRVVGTVKVPSSTLQYANTGQGKAENGVYGDYAGGRPAGVNLGHADADGTETVTKYTCAPSCPVFQLDAQAGVRTTGAWDGARNAAKTVAAYGAFAGTPETPRKSNAGTVSRFWFNTTDDAALYTYLRTLIAPDHLDDCAVPNAPLQHDDWRLPDAPDDHFHGLIVHAPANPALHEALVESLLRVLRPGAHLLLIAPEEAPINWRLVCAAEDAGFEVRDAILVPRADSSSIQIDGDSESDAPWYYCAKAPRSERFGLRFCSVCDYRYALPASVLRTQPAEIPCPKCLETA